MRPLVSTQARGMLFNQTARLAPYHPLHDPIGPTPLLHALPFTGRGLGKVGTGTVGPQVLHGRRLFVTVSRPVESTQRT